MWTSGATAAGSSSVPARTNRISAARVLAEHRDLARRATPDRLLRAVVARHGDRLRLAREELHAVGLDQHVDDERASGLPLTVQAMTAVNEEWVGRKAVANLSAGAAALTWDAHAHDLLLPDKAMGRTVVRSTGSDVLRVPMARHCDRPALGGGRVVEGPLVSPPRSLVEGAGASIGRDDCEPPSGMPVRANPPLGLAHESVGDAGSLGGRPRRRPARPRRRRRGRSLRPLRRRRQPSSRRPARMPGLGTIPRFALRQAHRERSRGARLASRDARSRRRRAHRPGSPSEASRSDSPTPSPTLPGACTGWLLALAGLFRYGWPVLRGQRRPAVTRENVG